MNHTIDATNKSLGRVASNAATILIGKSDVDFARNKVSQNTVAITNASKLKVDPRKMLSKTYKSFSGYQGGLKTKTMAHVTKEKGFSFALKEAISGMLPNNRLKKDMMKRLKITE